MSSVTGRFWAPGAAVVAGVGAVAGIASVVDAPGRVELADGDEGPELADGDEWPEHPAVVTASTSTPAIRILRIV